MAYFLPVVDEYVPVEMKEKVVSEWAHVHGDMEDDDEREINPIIQMAVMVSVDHGAVFIDTVADVEGVAGGAGSGRLWTNVSLQNQLVGVQLCLLSMRQENLGLRNAINTLKANMEQNLQIICGNI